MTMSSSESVRDSIKALRYHQVYSILRGWIFDGTYPAGSKLPPEGELCERLGVSRITSRKALDLLVSEGLVVRVQGKGTFVTSESNAAPTVGDMDQLIHRVTRASARSKVIDVQIREVVGSPEICRDLAVRKGSKVREISFVRTFDGKPTGYRQSFLPLDVAPGITAEEVRRKPMLQVFEDHGVTITAADTLVGACLADTRKAMILDTTVGVPLVRIRLVLFDDQKRRIERSTRYYLADYYEHHLYLTRSAGLNASALSI